MDKVTLCFAKTPGLTPAKTRLSKEIGTRLTEELYHLLILRCLELMGQLIDFSPLVAVNEKEGLKNLIWKKYPTYLQAKGELGVKLSHAEEHFFNHYEKICFWGTDSPSLTADHFRNTARLLETCTTVIIPAKDGGFILYASSKKLPPLSWESIHYSTSSTLHNLKKYTPSDTVFCSELSDLDTYDDVKYVIKEMNQFGSQGMAWDQLKYFLEKL